MDADRIRKGADIRTTLSFLLGLVDLSNPFEIMLRSIPNGSNVGITANRRQTNSGF